MVVFYLCSVNLCAKWEQNGLSSFQVLLLFSNRKQCIYGLWYSTLRIGIPTCVIIYCYFRIFTTVRHHNSNFHRPGNPISTVNVEEVKVASTIFVIVVLFSMCWLPVCTIDLVDAVFQKWLFPREVYVAYTFLGTISSALNPLIYGLLNKSFRKHYWKVLRYRCCRSQTVVEPLAWRGRVNVVCRVPLPDVQINAN